MSFYNNMRPEPEISLAYAMNDASIFQALRSNLLIEELRLLRRRMRSSYLQSLLCDILSFLFIIHCQLVAHQPGVYPW
jgi:hypothetical protein